MLPILYELLLYISNECIHDEKTSVSSCFIASVLKRMTKIIKKEGVDDYFSADRNSFPNFWIETIKSLTILAVTTGELKTTLKNSPWSTPEIESSGFGAKSVKKPADVCSLCAIYLVPSVICFPSNFLAGVGL